MGLIKELDLSGGLKVPNAYHMIAQVDFNKLTATLKVSFVSWLSAEKRAAFVAAKEALDAAMATIAEQETAFASATTGAERTAAGQAIVAAQEAKREAGPALTAADSLSFGMSPITVSGTALAGILDENGNPQLTNIYTYVKTLPEWSGAVDSD